MALSFPPAADDPTAHRRRHTWQHNRYGHIHDTVFEAGPAPFEDMGKADFIRRAALEDKDQRSCLFGATCVTETPVAGSQIFDGATAVGRITAGIPSPTLQLGIGYAVFSHPGDWVGRQLQMRLPNGDMHDVDIVNVPFFDHQKLLVSGVDRAIPDRPA